MIKLNITNKGFKLGPVYFSVYFIVWQIKGQVEMNEYENSSLMCKSRLQQGHDHSQDHTSPILFNDTQYGIAVLCFN